MTHVKVSDSNLQLPLLVSEMESLVQIQKRSNILLRVFHPL